MLYIVMEKCEQNILFSENAALKRFQSSYRTEIVDRVGTD